MPYIQEITAAVLLLGIVIFYLYQRPRIKEEKLRLLTKYKRTQNESLRLESELRTYILSNDALSGIFFKDTTFGDFLQQMQENHAAYLSEQLYLKLRNGNSVRLRRKVIRSLEEQKLRLDEVRKQLDKIKIKTPA